MFRILFIASICTLVACKSKEQREKLKKIKELTALAEGSDSLMNLDQSIIHYTSLLALDSTSILALENRGHVLIAKGEIEQGLADYNRAIRLYPENEKLYYARGLAYVQAQQFEEAKEDFQKILSLNQRSGDAFLGLSYVKEHEGNYNAAFHFCDQAEENGSDVVEVILRRCSMFDKQNNDAAAVQEMTRLIKMEPTNAIYYNNRGYIKLKMELYVDALQDLDTAIKYNPRFAYSYNNKAFALLKLDQPAAAMELVNSSLQLNNKNEYAFRNRGEIHVTLGNIAKACADFDTAATLNNDPVFAKELQELQTRSCH